MKLAYKCALPVLIVVGVVSIYFFADPARSVWMPKCAFKALTGFDCPGCGSQRMLHALLHLDLAAAWKANPFILCAAPVLALMIFSASTRRRFPRLYAAVNSLPSIISITLALILWTVLRNL